ncbi:4Fe-4S dicluster domain-containing protein [Deferrisoma camini]|uniref:4Fe-4S dicluster domain-containing protein n=1 Tax=Deferrisoma camini TaxID=1035120 RepID=UPI00046D9312|nr:4Fe-4S dicluster domain-containing protein [Deferrisoma camini]
MKKIFVDYMRCVACKGCEIACAVEHHPSRSLLGLVGDARTQVNVRVLAVEHEAFPVSCRHCDPAWCMDACPAGAISRDPVTAAVILDQARCKACGMCAMVCPFDAIAFKVTHASPDGRETAFKCDLCSHRVREGRLPACVEACHSGALAFREHEEVRRDRATRNLREYLLGQRALPDTFALYRELRRKEFARRGEPAP